MPFLVSLSVALFQRLAAKLPARKQEQLQNVASVVVPAVEQMWKNTPGTGVQKKAHAVEIATAMVNSMGLKVAPDVLNVYVEAAVRALPATAEDSPVPQGAL